MIIWMTNEICSFCISWWRGEKRLKIYEGLQRNNKKRKRIRERKGLARGYFCVQHERCVSPDDDFNASPLCIFFFLRCSASSFMHYMRGGRRRGEEDDAKAWQTCKQISGIGMPGEGKAIQAWLLRRKRRRRWCGVVSFSCWIIDHSYHVPR